jgi:hypothetical protein
LKPGSASDVEYRMLKVTKVYYGFVIPKNKCVKKRGTSKLGGVPYFFQPGRFVIINLKLLGYFWDSDGA